MPYRYARWPFTGLHLIGLLLLVSAAGLVPSAHAQEARTIRGVVTGANTGDPLPGVNVRVQNTTIGTSTDIDGRYELEVPQERETLVFSFIGYKEQEVDIPEGATEVNVEMEEDVVGLDEVVVTGLASGVKRQNLANSIETVSAAELTGTTSVETIDGALNGKVAGAQISSYSGAPGGGISVKLRGVSTINGNAQPLYIVDGVIVSNVAISTNVNAVTAAAAGGNRSSQDNPVNRIADLNPRDIQNIEILKGPSAAAIYGGRASNGVVIINTKRGSAGETRVDFSQALGFTTISNPQGMRQYTAATADSAFGDRGVELFLAAQEDGSFIDYEDEIFGQEGLLSRTGLSVSGGNESTRFYVSGLLQADEGIVERTGYDKYTARANIEHNLSERATISGSAFYANSNTRRGLTGNDNSGTTFGISLITTPNFADLQQRDDGSYPNHPFNAANPLQTIQLMTNEERVNRFIGGGEVSYNLFTTDTQSLRLVAEGGVDFFNYENIGFFPRELQFERNDADGPGTSILGQTKVINSNLRLLGVHSLELPDEGVTFTTQAGVTGANSDVNISNTVADDLIPGQQNIDQASAIAPDQERTFQNDRSFFAQEEINYSDRIIFTAGLRGDRSSLNGDVDQFYIYPRAALAINFTNFEFWNSDFFDQLKLRGAFGQTGNTAAFGTKFTSFDATNTGGEVGTLIATSRGFENVKPERQTEFETGFDISAFNERATLNFTVYRKEITDQLLQREIPSSLGFRLETFNGGTLVNRGLETSLTLVPVARENLRWQSRINFWTNDAEVESLPVPAFRAVGGGFGATLGEIRIEEGKSPTQIVGVDDQITQIFDETIGETGEWVTVMGGPDGSVDVEADGSSIIYELGNAAPNFEMSFDNVVNLPRGFSFSVLAHWRFGADNLNLSELLYDLNQTSPDFDDQVRFQRNVQNTTGDIIRTEFGGDRDFEVVGDCPQTSGDEFVECTFSAKEGEFRGSLFGISAAQFVQNASFFRIREVGVFYDLPSDALQRFTNGSLRSVRVGVSANNVLTITPYGSYDPEVNNFGAQPVAAGVEVAPYPSSRQFFFHLNVGL